MENTLKKEVGVYSQPKIKDIFYLFWQQSYLHMEFFADFRKKITLKSTLKIKGVNSSSILASISIILAKRVHIICLIDQWQANKGIDSPA